MEFKIIINKYFNTFINFIWPKVPNKTELRVGFKWENAPESTVIIS